jgi:hypothetical protein
MDDLDWSSQIENSIFLLQMLLIQKLPLMIRR